MSPGIRDALGREVPLNGPPARIVSLVPSLTELLATLGLERETVGLTRFCVRPAEWRSTRSVVGGTKDVRIDRVADLQPDLILANKEENERDQVEALAAIAPVYVTDVADVTGALAMIRALGPILDRAEPAARLADQIAEGFGALPDWPPLRTLYLIWREPFMAAGDGTFIHDVLARAGLPNVLTGEARYPELSAARIAELAPERILLSSEPYPFRAKHLPELRALVPTAQVELVDGELFSWYGSRILETPAALRALRGAE